MSLNNILIQENVSSDSLKQFKKEFKIKFNISFDQFKKKGEKTTYGYMLNSYRLERYPQDKLWRIFLF